MIPNVVLTRRGEALLARTPAGSPVPVTRWQLGTGALPKDADLTAWEGVAQPLKYLPVSSTEHEGIWWTSCP